MKQSMKQSSFHFDHIFPCWEIILLLHAHTVQLQHSKDSRHFLILVHAGYSITVNTHVKSSVDYENIKITYFDNLPNSHMDCMIFNVRMLSFCIHVSTHG